MLYISIDRAGETQTRKLKPHVTLDRAKAILHELRDNDEIGCDTWTLWDGEDEIMTLAPNVD